MELLNVHLTSSEHLQRGSSTGLKVYRGERYTREEVMVCRGEVKRYTREKVSHTREKFKIYNGHNVIESGRPCDRSGVCFYAYIKPH